MVRSITINLLLLVLAVSFHTSIAEPCAEYNCQTREKCDGVYDGGVCKNSGDVCCKLVKQQFRDKCPQFGGECKANCRPWLQELSARDCPFNTICCILV